MGLTPQHIFLKPRSGKAFTLIELVLVIVIVGIIATTGLPRFFDLLTFSANNYFTDVLSSMRYAQKLAVGMGCDVQVATTSTQLSLNLRTNCRSGNFTLVVRDPANGSNFVKNAPSKISINTVNLPIYFDSLGRMHRSTGELLDATVIVAGKTINIVAETGFVYAP